MTANPRLDLVIANHRRTILIVLLVVGLLALVASGWVLANPSTTTTTQEINEETVSTEIRTSGEVVTDGLWESGTVLENSDVYLLNATPELTVTTETRVPTEDSHVYHETVLVYEADRNGEVFWDDEDELFADDVAVDERTATSNATLEVQSVLERIQEIEEEVDGAGDVAVSVESRATYDTSTHEGVQVLSTAFESSGSAYWLEELPSTSDRHTETAEVEVTESPSMLLVGFLALLGTGSLAGAVYIYKRPEVDPEVAQRAVHERRYAEWISHGSIPMWVGEHHVELDTLEDVVDVAIDMNERVIHDRNRGLFAVVGDNVAYYYSARGNWEQTAWPDFNLDVKAIPGAGSDSDTESDAPEWAQADTGSSLDAPPADETQSHTLFNEFDSHVENQEHDDDDDDGGSERDPFGGELPDPDDEDAWKQL